jgi:hypothetical protein
MHWILGQWKWRRIFKIEYFRGKHHSRSYTVKTALETIATEIGF